MNQPDFEIPEILPFESYPQKGRALIGRVPGGNCRHGYGLRHMRLTGQIQCAYCGLDLIASYENWLTMALDHVIPRNICRAWGVPIDWQEDYSNRVLCCATCNTFDNRYAPEDFQRPSSLSLDAFYELRDAIFIERRKNILECHRQERSFFFSKPWKK